jgi:hypothetical protein
MARRPAPVQATGDLGGAEDRSAPFAANGADDAMQATLGGGVKA